MSTRASGLPPLFDCTHSGMALIKAALSMRRVLVRGGDRVDPRVTPALEAGPGKLAIEKLSTNDGWIVVPHECATLALELGALLEERAELDAWLKAGPPRQASWDTLENDREFLRSFAAFCEEAALHGGFVLR